MNTTAKAPSAAHVSRVLKAAYRERSISQRSRVRGLPNRSRGFVATQYPAAVVISYQAGSYTAGARQSPEALERIMQDYAEVLEKAGFVTEPRTSIRGYVNELAVTGRRA